MDFIDLIRPWEEKKILIQDEKRVESLIINNPSYNPEIIREGYGVIQHRVTINGNPYNTKYRINDFIDIGTKSFNEKIGLYVEE